jgi:hypothetical protein
MNRDYDNEQTIQCKATDDGKGFENDITDITGLIYRINFSSEHSGLTPELDYLTLRVTKAGGGGGEATEEEGDTAIDAAIGNSVPNARKYKTQKVYVVNASNSQNQGTVDYLVVQDNPPRRWLLNYITAGESNLNAYNLSNVVYVLEITGKTAIEIQNEMEALLDGTKS